MSQSTVDKTTQEKYYYVVTDQDGFVGKPVLVPSLEDESISFEQFYEDQIRKMYPYEEERDDGEYTIFLTGEALYYIPESLFKKVPLEYYGGEHITELIDDDEDRSKLIVHSQDEVPRTDKEINEEIEGHTHEWDDQSTVSSGPGVKITYWCITPACYRQCIHDQGASDPSTGVPVTSVQISNIDDCDRQAHDDKYGLTYQLEMNEGGDVHEFTCFGNDAAIEEAKEYIDQNKETFSKDETFDLWALDIDEEQVDHIWDADLKSFDDED